MKDSKTAMFYCLPRAFMVTLLRCLLSGLRAYEAQKVVGQLITSLQSQQFAYNWKPDGVQWSYVRLFTIVSDWSRATPKMAPGGRGVEGFPYAKRYDQAWTPPGQTGQTDEQQEAIRQKTLQNLGLKTPVEAPPPPEGELTEEL